MSTSPFLFFFSKLASSQMDSQSIRVLSILAYSFTALLFQVFFISECDGKQVEGAHANTLAAEVLLNLIRMNVVEEAG